MENKHLSNLSTHEAEEIRERLRGLAESLRNRKGLGNVSGIISDEDIVLNALMHPERGDVMITIIREKKGLQVFVSNRKDPGNPFSVMNKDEIRMFPGRRPLNPSMGSLKEGEFALFSLSVQDRESMRAHGNQLIEIWSVFFDIAEQRTDLALQKRDLTHVPVASMSKNEKYDFFKSGSDLDPKMSQVSKDLFEFSVYCSKYKQSAKEELVFLHPLKLKQNLGQFIRDIYPYGIRVTLRKDFPQEHKARIDEVRQAITTLSKKVGERISKDNPEEYNKQLKQISDFLNEVIIKDPEFSNFV